ncbi:MAG: extracellular solute-binding protein [Eubacterium sp.]|nr:extracellular solute-binding protein [Eubacterium sp.]
MKKKLLVMMLLMSFVALMLSGCGTGEGDSDGTGEGTSGSSVIKLVVWSDAASYNAINKLADEFKKENSSKVQLNIHVEKRDIESMKQSVVKDVEQAADVYPITDDIFMTLIAGGAIAEVSQESTTKADNQKEACDAFTYSNKQYAYPTSVHKMYCLYYNKSLYKSGDLKTLDDVLAVAEKNGKKVSMDMASGDIVYSFFGKAAGLKVAASSDGLSNTCNWNEKTTMTKGADVAGAMLAVSANKGFINQKTADAVKAMKSGSVVACIADVSQQEAIRQALGEDYAVAKLPTYTCGKKQIQMTSFASYKAMAVNYYSANKEWAQKFADWVTNEDNQKKLYENVQMVPTNKALTTSADLKKDSGVQAVVEQGHLSSVFVLTENYWAPTEKFGAEMAKGNKNVQPLLDKMTDGIKASISK